MASMKLFLLQVGFRRLPHANNNLIAIIPTESESDSLSDSISKNIPTLINSKHTNSSDSTKITNIQNFNNEGNKLKYNISIKNP